MLASGPSMPSITCKCRETVLRVCGVCVSVCVGGVVCACGCVGVGVVP